MAASLASEIPGALNARHDATPARDPEHDARAVEAIRRSIREIPFYAKRGHALPAPGASLASALAALPLLFKNDVRPTLPKQWVPIGRDVKAELASGELEFVETSGSTGQRLRILWDKGWWLRQEERAMRTNPRIAAALDGALGKYTEAILTTPVCGMGTCHAGDLPYEERVDEHRVFLNQRPDPTYWKPEEMERMVGELARHATIGLEADPMHLAALARFAVKTGRTLDVRGFVQLTYALTTRPSLRAIRRACGAPMFQLYGASETGVLFMEGEDEKLHHAPFTTHVELLPVKVRTPGAKDLALVVVTSMDRFAQPLLRFVVGDVVQVDRGGASRFTTVPPLVSIDGRVDDAIVLPDGGIVTAGAMDRAMADVASLAFFQANQRTRDHVEVDVVAEDGAADSMADDVRARLLPLFDGLTLDVRTVAAIAAEPSGKFRVSRRHFPIDYAATFEGCEGAKP